METKLKPLRKVQPPDCSSSILSLDVAACAHSGGSLSLSAVTPPPPPPPVGEAQHVEEREEEDLLLRDVSRHSDSVHAVVRLRPGQEDGRGDQTREERSVPPHYPTTTLPVLHACHSVSHARVFTGSPTVSAHLQWNY